MPDSFYSSIAPVDDFILLAKPESYVSLPADWCIVVADVANSTGAIAEGKYKAVNTVGVAVIAAATNEVRPLEVPYVFGGDGALVCVPGEFTDAMRRALAATAAMARESFDLELRAAVVPAAYVRAEGYDVRVARHRVSQHYVQCALFGGGTEFAERALKKGELPEEYLVPADASMHADYSGIECRWKEIPSPRDETVAVIVDATAGPDRALEVYNHVMLRVGDIYGTADQCNPVTEEGLGVTLSSALLQTESRLRTWGASRVNKLAYAIKQRVDVLVGSLLLWLGVRVGDVEWSRYKRDVVANTDFRKFDGCLRFVLAGSAEQRSALEHFLTQREAAGDLVYGVHVSTAAVMTCLIEHRQSAHVHFVDAAGGGYASAARALKAKDAPSN